MRETWRSGAGKCLLAFSILSSVILASCAQRATASTAAPTSTATSAAVIRGPANHVVIVPQTDLFAPYLLVINAGDTVTWMNNDTMVHTVVSAPRAAGGSIDPTPFQFVLQPGQQATITLRDAGLYYYYCGAHATLTPQGRAAALRTVRAYPLAMDGIIYVRGPQISAESSATITLSATNQFTPWLSVLSRGATVTWSNQTPQAQEVRTSPGYGAVNPDPFNVSLAANASASITLTTPGLYDYYATGAATLDPIWQRPSARSGVAGYPVPMEGVIAILDY